jgi:hypothetical protein
MSSQQQPHHMPFVQSIYNLNQILYDSNVDLISNICSHLRVSDEIKKTLIDKFLDPTILTKKPKKDPNSPKKAKSAYILFSNENRTSIKNKNEKDGIKLNMPQMSKKLGEEWKKLSDTEKEKYYELSHKDKERYETDKETYQNKLFCENIGLEQNSSENI